jgi:AAA+ ATPase superfamily predicted ATPase
MTVTSWRFYGRERYTRELEAIFERGRWFFVKVTGRRRIGKTTLIQAALKAARDRRPILYVQLPDSEPAGVLSAVNDALETFHVPADRFPKPKTLADLAVTIGALAEASYVIVLDEFQYLHRKGYEEFLSLLQATVDQLSARAELVRGGLIVMGSIQTEMAALLEDRAAPLFGRVTDDIDLPHLDIVAVSAILRDHADDSPERFLFLWNLFEGVPKFYRDCYERNALGMSRIELLKTIFFESSAPLRTEADNWFLRELRGRYDVVLKTLARHPGSMHNELVQAIANVSGGTPKQVGGYLQALIERFKLVEKKLPIFAKPEARKSRYYLTDNFLQAWLSALAQPVSALAFRPVDDLVAEADRRLQDVEGKALEKLTRQLYHERSRSNVGDFPLTNAVEGYWDRADTEIDLVACNATAQRIRFVSCKRSPEKLVADASTLKQHAARFLAATPAYAKWHVDYAGVAPSLNAEQRAVLMRNGVIGQDLHDLMAGLVQ